MTGLDDRESVMQPEQMDPEQLKKFLVYYRKRIDREPRNVEARLRLATVFREMGQTHRAIEQYEEAAQLLDEQGLALEAIAACKAILELDPSRIEAQYFLARLYAQTPDATDESARVARPVEPADQSSTHELTKEADEADGEEPETLDEQEPDREEPAPTIERSAAGTDRPSQERTRVADYEELTDGEVADEGDRTIELTPEEQERRDGFSREEMQELLTTIDVDPEDIVDIENVDDYDLDDDFDSETESEEPDFELGAEFEIDESEVSTEIEEPDE